MIFILILSDAALITVVPSVFKGSRLHLERVPCGGAEATLSTFRPRHALIHYIMCHSLNGQFTCEWCDFTTVDAGTFVQHIHHHNESPWKCSKCRHISLNEEDHQKHTKGHSGSFPHTCQICGYGALRSDYLKKHTAAVHKEEAERRNVLKAIDDSPANGSASASASATLKLLLKKSVESLESQRVSKLTGSLPNQNGRLVKPEISVEETHHFVDSRKENKNSGKGSHNTELTMPIKCPRRLQPVVVLNHPDADIPEVANIMKIVNRHKGAVTKVSLSPKTIQAFADLGASSHKEDPRPRPVERSVRERFLLKLMLRKKSKKKYEVVDTVSGCRGEEPVVFNCWFCGRLFNNQEDWIGHGQRHLMEATRDWNKLF
ncbi:Zinc finger protein 518A [Liparis tanakae]|uniref:Zinc finger protein 518A n=1 Tax=Liparis tanakae TaxID=230148 RepID=A0A4Z2FFB7_9TELE|nr:Zinc finger protein 518A [Liparis tanakae]